MNEWEAGVNLIAVEFKEGLLEVKFKLTLPQKMDLISKEDLENPYRMKGDEQRLGS